MTDPKKKRSTIDEALLAANLGEYINLHDEKDHTKQQKEPTSNFQTIFRYSITLKFFVFVETVNTY